jgi:hypothetical protein
MNPLLYWSMVVWLILSGITWLGKLFATEPKTRSVKSMKVDVLVMSYFIVIVVLWLCGVFN